MRYFGIIWAVLGIFGAVFGQTSWTKWSGNPIVPAGATGQWDRYRCAVASVVATDSGYTMYYNGSDGTGSWLLGVGTSPDGYNWTRHEANPLASPEGWSPTAPYGPYVLPDIGTGGWMMFGTRYGAGDFYDVCRALSTDGIQWWMDPAEPVFGAGPEGAWDCANIFLPSIFTWRDTLWMTYSAYNDNEAVAGIGLAFSLDEGETWTRDSTNNPVFVPSSSPVWDQCLWDARVTMWNESLFVMVYTGSTTISGIPSIGVATSQDLRHWTRAPNNPVVRRGTPSAWDNYFVYQPFLADLGNGKAMYYCGVNSGGIGGIGMAVPTASDIPESQIVLLPQELSLAAYPNPFNSNTTFTFSLPNPSHVQLQIWDILGRQVAVLKDSWLPSGESRITWETDGLSSGTYYVRLDANGTQVVRPIMLIK